MDRKADYNQQAIIKLLDEVNNKLTELKIAVKLDDLDIAEINVDTTSIINRLDTIITNDATTQGLISDIKTLLTANLPKLDKLAELSNKLTDLIAAVGSTNSKIDTASTTLGNIKSKTDDIKDNTDTIKADVDTIKTTTTNIKTNTDDIKSNVATIKSDVVTIKTDNAVIKSDVSDIKTVASNIKTDTGNIKSNTDNIKSNTNTANELLDDIKTLVTTFNTNVATLKDDVNDIKQMMISEDLEKEYFMTMYTINQINPLALPEQIIDKKIASKDATETIEINGINQYVDVIRRIREQSDIYVGKYNLTNDELDIKLVSKTDKSIYADDTPVVITSSDEYDVFMKLPAFWWKCEEIAEDVYNIKFSMSNEYVDNTWNYWDGTTFIGVYKGYLDTNTNKYYSKPGVTPTVNKSWTDLKSAARARYSNNKYTIITYEAHVIMALLGYGWLNTTDAQAVIGIGTDTYPKQTGGRDAKGMTDTVYDVDGNNGSINFWGLENWWGDIAEWIDDIQTANTTGLINILKADGTVDRTIQAQSVLSVGGEIGKFVLGTDADLIPKETHTNSNYNKAYAAYGNVSAYAYRVARRSGYAAGLVGGIGFLNGYDSATMVDSSIGSRLQYKGAYSVVDNF